MKARQRRVHAVVNLRAFCWVGFRHVRLPKNAAVGESHDKERSADNTFVLAIKERLGDRKAFRVKSADHPIFAVDRMRGRQQLAGRLSAQDVTSWRRFDEIGWIGLSALELADDGRTGEAWQM